MDDKAELSRFLDAIRERHGRVNPCFMTGKGCVYTDQIDHSLKMRELRHEAKGFMIMPFRPRLRVFFENCLRPFFYHNYDSSDEPGSGPVSTARTIALERADDVARPGIIVCEGICKRIQDADFVVADISVANDNVFYELGLAYGIGQKILLIHQKGAKFGAQRAEYFGSGKVKAYDNLQKIESRDFKVSNHLWRREPADAGEAQEKPPEILFFEMMRDGKEEPPPPPAGDYDRDIPLSFSQHIMSDVGLALDRIAKVLRGQEESKRAAIPSEYLNNIIARHLTRAEKVDPADEFMKTRDRVDRSYCVIVRTGMDCHPMSYFWLGYGHARGKNVIPITKLVMDGPENDAVDDGRVQDERLTASARQEWTGEPRGRVLDLAFDIRAQRHMTFDPQHPELLEHQLEQTLSEMIRADFSEWSRRRFWATLLGSRGEVSIITGGLHSEDHNREMVGDWDLRAASELTSYFSRHQYRPKIETPIYQPEFAKRFDEDMQIPQYIDQVTREIGIADKNCVVIASPDVNPLTEILLGRLFGVPDHELFSGKTPSGGYPNAAFVVLKKRKKSTRENGTDQEGGRGGVPSATRVFYREEEGEDHIELRGFESRAFETEDARTLQYYGQNEYKQKGEKSFAIYAQLIVARNPFTKPEDPTRYVVILNGVSGPATFALTQVLTGGNEELEPRKRPAFDPAGESESILNKFLPGIRSSDFHCVYSLIEVDVGEESTLLGEEAVSSEGTPQRAPGAGATSDWRGVLGWKLAEKVLSDGPVKKVKGPPAAGPQI